MAITILLSALILPLMITPVYSESTIKVGLYYYVWYNGVKPSESRSGDTPVIGWYNSQNVSIISKHMEWFEDLHIDFLIVSWWGNSSFSELDDAEIIDVAAQRVFSTVKEKEYDIKLAIMVEPFNQSSGQYNFTTIYNYVNDTYVSPYPNIYMKLYDRPLLLFYNEDVNMTRDGVIPKDDRFEIRISGHQWYADWVYWSVNVERWGEGAPDYLGQTEQRLCRDGEINVIPRYDDEHFRPGGGVPNPIDRTYAGGLYDEQWSRVLDLAMEGQVNIVTITSWNEYPERTMIEPSIDATSTYKENPYFLFDKTKTYILMLKLLGKYNNLLADYQNLNSTYCELLKELNIIKNLMYILIATTVILIATTIYFAKKKT